MNGQKVEVNPFNVSGEAARRVWVKRGVAGAAAAVLVGLAVWGAAMIWPKGQEGPVGIAVEGKAGGVELGNGGEAGGGTAVSVGNGNNGVGVAGGTSNVVSNGGNGGTVKVASGGGGGVVVRSEKPSELDGLYIRKTVPRVDVVCRHAQMNVTVPVTSTGSYAFKYRELEGDWPGVAEMTLLSNTQMDLEILKAAGVSDDTVARMQDLDGTPLMGSAIERANAEALYGNYDRMEDGAAKDTARFALIDAVGKLGDKYTAEARERLKARKALMSPDQVMMYIEKKEEAMEAIRVAKAATRPGASTRPAARGGRRGGVPGGGVQGDPGGIP